MLRVKLKKTMLINLNNGSCYISEFLNDKKNIYILPVADLLEIHFSKK